MKRTDPDVEWEPLQVPSMDTIRRAVAEPGSGPYPSTRDWGHGEVFLVVQKRWRRAVAETCTHPYGFQTSLATNMFGEPRVECPRCYKPAPKCAAEPPLTYAGLKPQPCLLPVGHKGRHLAADDTEWPNDGGDAS